MPLENDGERLKDARVKENAWEAIAVEVSKYIYRGHIIIYNHNYVPRLITAVFQQY